MKIDRKDNILAEHNDFTGEELEFIVNSHIDYRMVQRGCLDDYAHGFQEIT